MSQALALAPVPLISHAAFQRIVGLWLARHGADPEEWDDRSEYREYGGEFYYFAACRKTSRLKFGWSRRPYLRMREISDVFRGDFKLVIVAQGGCNVGELNLLKDMAEYSIGGEFFAIDGPVSELVTAICVCAEASFVPHLDKFAEKRVRPRKIARPSRPHLRIA